jgi:hypothetical protein
MKRMIYKIGRILQWSRAFICGYFWLPCPICGHYFGGHEIGGSLMISHGMGQCVCKSCVAEANRRNKEFLRINPLSPIKVTV